jgi:hypothetical protein
MFFSLAIFAISAIFAASLFARQNPFELPEDMSDRNSTIALLPQQLEEEKIELPLTSRILRGISVTHQEDDGTIATINRRVDRLVDPRALLRVDQPNAEKLPRKSGVFLPVEPLENIERVKFFTAGDVMKIRTKDVLERSFFLPRPGRITLDFNSSVPLKPQSTPLIGGFFTAIDITFHDSFYRVVVTLDAYYPYTIERVSDGYLLGLN